MEMTLNDIASPLVMHIFQQNERAWRGGEYRLRGVNRAFKGLVDNVVTRAHVSRSVELSSEDVSAIFKAPKSLHNLRRICIDIRSDISHGVQESDMDCIPSSSVEDFTSMCAFPDGAFRRLFGRPWPRLRCLRVVVDCNPRKNMQVLASASSAGHLPCLEELYIFSGEDHPVPEDALLALGRGDWNGLRDLSLDWSGLKMLTPASMKALCRSCPGLTTFDCSNGYLNADVLRAITWLDLRHFSLRNCLVNASTMEELSTNPVFKGVRELTLQVSTMSLDAMRMFAKHSSTQWRHVEYLSLCDCKFEEDAYPDGPQTPTPGGLDMMRALTRTHLPALETLLLDSCNLECEHVLILCEEGGDWPQLQTLVLGGNEFGFVLGDGNEASKMVRVYKALSTARDTKWTQLDRVVFPGLRHWWDAAVSAVSSSGYNSLDDILVISDDEEE